MVVYDVALSLRWKGSPSTASGTWNVYLATLVGNYYHAPCDFTYSPYRRASQQGSDIQNHTLQEFFVNLDGRKSSKKKKKTNGVQLFIA